MSDPRNESAIPAHVAEQYEAGYSARFRDEAYTLGATLSWQAGWNNANRELGKFDEAFSPAQSSYRSLERETRRGDGNCRSIQAAPKSGSAVGSKRTSSWVWRVCESRPSVRRKPIQGRGDGEAMESSKR